MSELNQSPPQNDEAVLRDRTINDQAIQWLVCLTSGSATPQDARACDAWRQQSTVHDEAFCAAQRVWKTVGVTSRRASLLVPASPGFRWSDALRRPVVTWGSAVASLLVLVWLWAIPWEGAKTMQADYRTARGEQQLVTLSDGSQVRLNTATAIKVAFSETARNVELLYGEAEFTVSPDSRRPFKVVGNEVTSEALGTQFLVRTSPESTRVAVLEHAVRVSAHSQVSTVEAGEGIRFTPAQGLGSREPVNIRTLAAWRHGKLIVESQPLQSVIEEVNRYHSGRIVVLNPALKAELITAVLPLTDADEALAVLQSTLHLHMVRLTPLLVLLY